MPDLDQLESDLNSMQSALENLESRFPSIVGVETVNILRQNFQLQGYDSGSAISKWNKRSPNTNKAYDYNRTASYRTPKLGKVSIYKNPYKGSVVQSKNPLLLQTGNLRDSISYRVSGRIVEVGVFPRQISINGVVHDAVAYAQIHNEGGSTMWGKHSVKIPRRQFMPRPNDNPNPKIIKAVKAKWDFEEQKIMSKFEKTGGE
jgi:phage gpG-like protein